MSSKPQWDNSRKVIERIYISGDFLLKTPAHFGNGDADGPTDIPLHYDPLEGEKPLLTGASIAGALRNYLREYEKGYGWEEQIEERKKSVAETLFGHLDIKLDNSGKESKSTVQSWLMVDDALGAPPPAGDAIELRDGVAIDPRTRTVQEDESGGHKFDFELLAAGTTFPLRFEFWRTEEDDLLPALATALQGLEQSKIRLGTRKRRGLGLGYVPQWRVSRYSMQKAKGLIGWLNLDQENAETTTNIVAYFNAGSFAEDRRKKFTLKATFDLDGSLLIRSYSGSGNAPDTVHLRSQRKGVDQPILPGTSLAGVIRSRALRIAKTMLPKDLGGRLIDEMFGKRIKDRRDEPTGSRVIIEETEVEAVTKDLVQNRVKIDRFTGGAYPQALFSQQPVWGQLGGEENIKISLELLRPCQQKDANAEAVAQRKFKAQVGLLLLVLKDLWTGDLPLGGESSVGRGRLRGRHASMTYEEKTWTIDKTETNSLKIEGWDTRNPAKKVDAKVDLENFVDAFCKWNGDQPEGDEHREPK